MSSKEKKTKAEENLATEKKGEELPKRRRRQRRGSGLVGVVLVSLGVIFLLENLGLLPVGFWDLLWRFWPVVLILLGIEVMLGRSFLARVIVFLVGLLVVAWIILATLSVSNPEVRQWMEKWTPEFLRGGRSERLEPMRGGWQGR